MSDSHHVKQVTLTGDAAVEFTGGKKGKRTTRSKKALPTMTGGSTAAAASSSVPPMVPTPSPILPAPMPVNHSSRLTGSALSEIAPRLLPSSAPVPPSIQPVIQPPSQTGGADTKTIKVELKKRQHTKKVQLQPKKVDAPIKGSLHHGKKSQTKKSRKITLGIKSLHKRMDRAKKMTRKVKEMPLEKLREHLIQKKLIKPTSKAPESVLRQIAADAQIVAGKAL